MLILEFVGKAHVAALTMEKLVSSTDPADAATITVILVFVLVIKQFALQAGILENSFKFKLNSLVARLRRSAKASI